MKTGTLNRTDLKPEQLTGCECGGVLYLPYLFFNNETKELTPTGDCVLRMQGSLPDTYDQRFMDTLEFACNVGIGEGFAGLNEHMKINGYDLTVTGALKRIDFLKKEGQWGYEDVNFELFRD